jgi:hypothetical protein
MFSILNIGILYLSGENFSLFLVLYYSCKRCVFIYVYAFSLIWCAGSVGISLAGRVLYILCAYLFVVWSGGPVQFYLVPVAGCLAGPYRFSFPWFCSGGHSTGETVKGGDPFFPLLPSVCCQFSWRMDIGRNIVLYFLLVIL